MGREVHGCSLEDWRYVLIGGQAVFEGVMMRSPKILFHRCAESGSVDCDQKRLSSGPAERRKILRLPIIRVCHLRAGFYFGSAGPEVFN